jgi:hypothetical protein
MSSVLSSSRVFHLQFKLHHALVMMQKSLLIYHSGRFWRVPTLMCDIWNYWTLNFVYRPVFYRTANNTTFPKLYVCFVLRYLCGRRLFCCARLKKELSHSMVPWLELALPNGPTRTGLPPSHLRTETDPVSKLLHSLAFFRILDDSQSTETQ